MATNAARVTVFVTVLAILAALAAAPGFATAEEALFVSRQLTPSGEYTGSIEGPAVDADGTLYVVNFGRQGTIGKVRAGATRSEPFAALPDGSIGNGIRFDRDGRMYVADFKQHNVLVFERGQTTPSVYFHSDRFHQPNDLAIAADGTLCRRPLPRASLGDSADEAARTRRLLPAGAGTRALPAGAGDERASSRTYCPRRGPSACR
jgi:streptogramin lyase